MSLSYTAVALFLKSSPQYLSGFSVYKANVKFEVHALAMTTTAHTDGGTLNITTCLLESVKCDRKSHSSPELISFRVIFHRGRETCLFKPVFLAFATTHNLNQFQSKQEF